MISRLSSLLSFISSQLCRIREAQSYRIGDTHVVAEIVPINQALKRQVVVVALLLLF